MPKPGYVDDFLREMYGEEGDNLRDDSLLVTDDLASILIVNRKPQAVTVRIDAVLKDIDTGSREWKTVHTRKIGPASREQFTLSAGRYRVVTTEVIKVDRFNLDKSEDKVIVVG